MTFTGPFEDRLAIRELLDTYADAVTRRDADACGVTWAGAGVWWMRDYPDFLTQEGRANIVGLWVEAMKQFPGILFQAWAGSIDVDGDTAKVRSYTSEVYDQEGLTKRDRGAYDDVCVKRDGKWLFKSRTFRNLHRQHGPKGC